MNKETDKELVERLDKLLQFLHEYEVPCTDSSCREGDLCPDCEKFCYIVGTISYVQYQLNNRYFIPLTANIILKEPLKP